jgi:hypothetical protein
VPAAARAGEGRAARLPRDQGAAVRRGRLHRGHEPPAAEGRDHRRGLSFCRATAKLYRDPSSAFAQIKADRSAKPKLLGRTRDLSFYSLSLRTGRYMALVTAGQLGGFASDELQDHVNPSVLEFLTVRQPTSQPPSGRWPVPSGAAPGRTHGGFS